MVSQHFKAEQQPVLLILGNGLLRQPTGAKVDDGIDDHQAPVLLHLVLNKPVPPEGQLGRSATK